MSSFADNITEGSKNAFDMTRNVALDTFNETGNLIKNTGDVAGKTLKGATNLASNTFNRGSNVASDILHGNVKETINSSTKLVTDTVGEVIDDIEGSIKYTLTNKYVSTTIKVLIALYAAFAAPSLSKNVAVFFDNTLVKITIAILIAYLATKDASMAILVALAFILTLQTANKYKLIDTSNSVSSPGQLSWLSSSKGNQDNQDNQGNQEHFSLPEDENSPLPHETGQLASYPENNDQTESEFNKIQTNNVNLNNQEDVDTLSSTNIHETDMSGLGSNSVPGANQQSCVQSWKNEHCTQGLNYPEGYDSKVFPYSQT